MKLNEVRQKYLDFFKAQGHLEIPSASLVPENDPTTLFTGSGMQPLVPYLLGEKHPLGKRLTNSQKSFRAEDIEEVGDNRHTTFFEMLGNWSLGDYFKAEQLPWFFHFLTDKEAGVGLDPERLYVTVFMGDEENGIPRDEESVKIWQKLFASKGIDAKAVEVGSEARGGEVGMQGGRIFYYDAKKNWWSRAGIPKNMPSGEPGGPDSEVFYDFQTPHDSRFGKECHPNCDCGRFLEIGNSVFMEYRKKEDGTFERLPQRNVDFGGGLERIAAATIGDPDVFQVDALLGLVDLIGFSAGKKYQETTLEERRRYRTIADHVRAAVFLIGDRVLPGNKGQGYVLRRLIRRAIVMARFLNLKEGWLLSVAHFVIDSYSGHYEVLHERAQVIRDELSREFEQFNNTLDQGFKEFERLAQKGITAKDAFDLHQSFGFPWELTRELALNKGIVLNSEEFSEEFKKHQELSRTATAGVFKGGLADTSEKVVRLHTATHLLNAALRKVLGLEVWQKGSNITHERTRFDFTHGAKMTEEEKAKVEALVNEWVERDLSVKKEVMPLEMARSLGAIGVFGEKYPETVSVYTVYDSKTEEVVSREFCGGPHVEHTGLIGKIKIQKEEASSQGVRRIKAIIEE